MSVRHRVEHRVGSPSRDPRTQLGDYSLIAELARGGMGKVFLARRVAEAGFERLYAIKTMHEHMQDDEEAVLMLLDEARIAARLHHPNVVPITDIGTYDAGYFLVMDYVEGSSLQQLLSRNRMTRHARLVVPIVVDALHGLHAAHELRDDDGRSIELVHRDFSPHNLLVGTDGLCRVTDFGIAKARARFSQTDSRMQKGKLTYMSPEQLAADETIDRRADVWAAGVVLYYALSGVHPFRGKSEALTIRNIISRDVRPPSEVGLRPPSSLDEVCLRALSRDRDGRYESADAMANELRRIAMRDDLLAPPSQVGAWVTASFRYELEARRRTIRAARGEEGDIAFIGLPVLPHMSSTPSTGGREVDGLVVQFDLAPSSVVPPPALSAALGPGARSTPPPSQPPPARPAPSSHPAAGPPPRLPLELASARAGRRGRTAVVAAGATALVVALCVAAFLVGRSGVSGPGPAEEAREVPPPAAATPDETPGEGALAGPADAAPDPTPSSAAEPRTRARITLGGVPPGARLRLDGVDVPAQPVEVPRDGREHVLRVDAEGYRQWSLSFVPEGDETVEVALEPAGGQGRRPGSRSRAKSRRTGGDPRP